MQTACLPAMQHIMQSHSYGLHMLDLNKERRTVAQPDSLHNSKLQQNRAVIVTQGLLQSMYYCEMLHILYLANNTVGTQCCAVILYNSLCCERGCSDIVRLTSALTRQVGYTIHMQVTTDANGKCTHVQLEDHQLYY